MTTNHNPRPTEDTVQGRILTLLDDLPPESQVLVEQFTRSLHEKARRGGPVALTGNTRQSGGHMYPSVPLPASTLSNWLDLVPEGYEGDALADSESLYDET
jgi:hypothetical protein